MPKTSSAKTTIIKTEEKKIKRDFQTHSQKHTDNFTTKKENDQQLKQKYTNHNTYN